ncbi:hypothetical protein TNCV_1509101, partial [Trichonephila clavipes]
RLINSLATEFFEKNNL